MGTKFFRGLIAGLSMMLSFSNITVAADYVQRVIIANEGYNDFSTGQQLVPVTIASYDPLSKTYSVFDTITGARFATQVIVADDYIFVAADVLLVKYDRYTLQRLASQNVVGLRGIAAWNDKIIVTRGEIGGLSSYFQVYNQEDLSLDYELDSLNGPKYATQDIQIIDDKAYFVINNAFDWSNIKGLIGIVDLTSEAYIGEYDLGPDGLNPDNLMREGDILYTLNNKDFTGSSVSIVNLGNATQTTTALANVSAGCGTSTYFTSHVWYQQYGSAIMFAFDPITQQIVDSAALDKEFYGMEVDPVNNLLYATATDYVSTGMAYIYDASRVLIDSFAVGVSAGSLAFDVRKTTGIEAMNAAADITLSPNPAVDKLKIEFSDFKAEKLEVFDASGKRIATQLLKGDKHSVLNIQSLSSGIYSVVVTNENGMKANRKFAKQ